MSQDRCSTPSSDAQKAVAYLREAAQAVRDDRRGGRGSNVPRSYCPSDALLDMVADLIERISVHSESAQTIASCRKCGKTPPFPGGTRCQDLACPLIRWDGAKFIMVDPVASSAGGTMYTPDQQRVADWIFARGLGGGDDPIGFLLTSYEYVMAERNAQKTATKNPADSRGVQK